jgi:hypothetical protein
MTFVTSALKHMTSASDLKISANQLVRQLTRRCSERRGSVICVL